MKVRFDVWGERPRGRGGRTYLPSPKRSIRPVSMSMLEISISSLSENIASSTDA
jgi:hypothetical protein